MQIRRLALAVGIVVVTLLAFSAHAQGRSGGSPWVIDLGLGIDVSINGNVCSGAWGTLDGQTAAILPNSYCDVYGTGMPLLSVQTRSNAHV